MAESGQPLLSIVVPVYNVSNYLRQCVTSILDQAFESFELILIDDGSDDDSGAICDMFAAQDTRVHVLHKQNGGLSDARNAGIAKTEGQYLLFVDGDDYIAPGSLSAVAEALREDSYPDVLFLRAEQVYPDGTMKPYGRAWTRDDFYRRDRETVLAMLAGGGQFHVSACIKAIKRQLVLETGGFWKGVIGEDVDFSIALYLAASSYSYCGVPYYFYRQKRPGSIMTEENGRRIVDLLKILHKWTTLAEGGYSDRRRWVLRFIYHQYYTLLLAYAEADEATKTDDNVRQIKGFAYLLRYADNRRKAIILSLMYAALGLDRMARLLCAVQRKG